ncbi:MAG: hypothetical protein NTV51_27150 [Verrucomicrobia bacterium]|nr:hypothetical protein [Verrucomicrobiota bacterium]
MSPPRTSLPRRTVRWVVPAALLALAPKCLVCLLGYAGLGAALGLAGPELCGAPESSLTPSMVALGVAGTALGLGTGWTVVRLRHRRSSAASATPSSLG